MKKWKIENQGKCTTCRHFRARSPWCGFCNKVSAPCDYEKEGCPDFSPASPEFLEFNKRRIDYFNNMK